MDNGRRMYGTMTRHQWIEHNRNIAIPKIITLLVDGKMGIQDIADRIGTSVPYCASVLRYMRINNKNVRPLPRRNNKSQEWEIGLDPTATKSPSIDKMLRQKHVFTKAKQIGMVRDPLVAALFGGAA